MLGRLCFALLFIATPVFAADPAAPAESPSPAMILWQRGQEIMRDGDSGKAIPFFQESLRLDPDLTRNHLSLAAAYTDQGNDEFALLYMASYVAKQPQHFVARLHYADMLFRLERPKTARIQYECFIADVQDREELANANLVHCHSRLMDIYEAESDAYHEHLNRGLGLYQLACQRAGLPNPDGELSVESLLFRAAAELMVARKHNHNEARASWYLHLVWSRLGQKQPATRWLRIAEAASPPSDLTPAEKRGLHIAWERFQEDGRK